MQYPACDVLEIGVVVGNGLLLPGGVEHASHMIRRTAEPNSTSRGPDSGIAYSIADQSIRPPIDRIPELLATANSVPIGRMGFSASTASRTPHISVAATDHRLDARSTQCSHGPANRDTYIPLQDKSACSCLSLVAALVPARSLAAVLPELPLSPGLPLPHTPHTQAFASAPQTASASCTTWDDASLVSASSTSSNAASPAIREQVGTSTRLHATPTPSTARPGSRSARSFVRHRVFE